MSDLTQKELEAIGQKAGEAVSSQMVKALQGRKVNYDYVAMKLKQLMNWKETKKFQFEGKVIESKKFRSGGIIMKATAVTVDIFGGRAPEKVDHDHQVTILRPDPIEKREK
ncbi:hypothetical protein LCGC14_1203550 [marine sediment metagenome]|uniref:Uncharacterized protein n=1 Tax=marine sediment metagenome TaxID=412755 RepID=A0A0F9LKJ9_9ZZZZ